MIDLMGLIEDDIASSHQVSTHPRAIVKAEILILLHWQIELEDALLRVNEALNKVR